MDKREELKAACEAAKAHMWAVWAKIGGKDADELVRTMQLAPQLQSGYVYEGTYGLPKWKAKQVQREREGAKARAQARFEAVWAAKDALREHPEFLAAQAAVEAAQAAVDAANPAYAKPLSEEEREEQRRKDILSFRWNGKDNDGDWADD